MKQIPLTQGKFALVSDCDYKWLSQWKWHYGNRGYAVRWSGKSRVGMHVAVMKRAGRLGLVGQVDHWDRNKLNNTRSNLRMATIQQQRANVGPRSSSKSGFKGVHPYKKTSLWVAQISFGSARLFLGIFSDKEDAAREYDRAAKEFYGPFTYLNFP